MASPSRPAASAGSISILRMRRVAAACSLALPALSPAVAAEEGGVVLPPITVTATMTAHDTVTAPASVSIVGRDELARRNAEDLLDAVSSTPGIGMSPRQVGGRRTLALRGLEGRHTLTLIDGRRISPTDDVVGHSDYQYGWLPMSAVERVEIIRGPMSTLYGSEALGGVINLIPRRPTDRWIGAATVGGHALSGGGGDGHRLGLFAAGPVAERVSLRLHAEDRRSAAVPLAEDPRESELEARRTRSFGGAVSFTPSAGHTLEAGWSGVREDREYDALSGATEYRNHYDVDRSQAHLSWRGEFDGWTAQTRAYRSTIDIGNRRTSGVASTRPQNLEDEVIDAFATRRWGSHRWTVGTELRRESLVNAGLAGGADSASHKALFAQDEFSLARTLTLTWGVRADHHELFGTEASPRAYLVWEASPALVVKGGYGHAFKAPTLKQISPNYVGAEGPHTFLGNAAVKPETADAFELSADWQRGALGLRATLFHTRVDDLITYRLLSVNGTRRTYLYDNVERARLSGLETGFTWQFAPAWRWNADLTLLHAKNASTGTRLDDRPRVLLASQLDWQGGDGWSARLGADHTGSQTTAGLPLPSYTLWKASVGKRIGKALTLRAGVDNLGDLRLAEESPTFGYALRGRTLYASVAAEF